MQTITLEDQGIPRVDPPKKGGRDVEIAPSDFPLAVTLLTLIAVKERAGMAFGKSMKQMKAEEGKRMERSYIS